MKPRRVIVPAAFMAAGLLATTTPAVLAQGEFPLKYVDAPPGDPLVSGSMTYWGGALVEPGDFRISIVARTGPGRRKPKLKQLGPQAMPKGLSGKVYSCLVYIGGWQTWVVLDPSPTPRLYVDTAGTGDLSAVEPLADTGPPNEPFFGPVAVPAVGPDGEMTSVKVRLHVRNGGRLLGVSVAGYMAGEVNLGGKTCRVALVNRSLRGRYDVVVDLSKPDRSTYEATTLAIDLDDDGQFGAGLGSGERMPLLPGLRAGDAYYRVQVKPDGLSIRLEKVEPELGTLNLGCPDASVMLLSDLGVLTLSGSERKRQVPACAYRAINVQVARTDGGGVVWRLRNMGSMGRLGGFKVRAGETLSLKAGPPLKATVEAKSQDGGGSKGIGQTGQVQIALTLVGQAGETYAPGVVRGRARMLPPALRILDEASKVLAQGNFEYG